MTDTLTSYLDEHVDDAQSLLEQLCRQPSVAAQRWGIAEMADLVELLLRETGFSTQRLVVEGAPPVIFGELPGRSPYTVLLYLIGLAYLFIHVRLIGNCGQLSLGWL